VDGAFSPQGPLMSGSRLSSQWNLYL